MQKQIKLLADATESKEKRDEAEIIIKGQNRMKGSKYMKPSFSSIGLSYNQPRKEN